MEILGLNAKKCLHLAFGILSVNALCHLKKSATSMMELLIQINLNRFDIIDNSTHRSIKNLVKIAYCQIIGNSK